MSDLALINKDQFAVVCQQADVLSKSGLFPQALNTKEKILAVMLAGHELGIPPMRASRGMNVIQGKVELSPELLLELAYLRIPGFSVKVIETGPTKVTMQFTRKDNEPHTESFSIEEAKAAGIVRERGGWATFPEAMLRARCISKAKRVYFPDAAGGCYVTGEIGGDEPAEAPSVEPREVEVIPPTEEAPPKKAKYGPAPTPLEEPDPERPGLNMAGEVGKDMAKSDMLAEQGWTSHKQRDAYLSKLMDLSATKELTPEFQQGVDDVDPVTGAGCQKSAIEALGKGIAALPDREGVEA